MSQWKLPVIESKKQFADEQDYNFVNKDKKKAKDQTGALSMIQELKYKIQQQKKEIQNRNATIMGLQRNFQSLSGIVKHQKAQSAALKAQLQNLRLNSQTGDKRALQFHQKAIILQNQNKMLKQQLTSIKKTHSQCHKIANQSQIYKNKIAELQQLTDKYSTKLDALNQQKRSLQNQLAKARSEQKSRRQLQQRIIDLQQQLRKGVEENNILFDKNKILQDKIRQAKSGSANNQSKLNDLVRKIKQEESRRKLLQQQNDGLKKQLKQKSNQIIDMKKSAQSMDVYSKMRAEQQQQLKGQLKAGKNRQEKLQQRVDQLNRQSNNRLQTIKVNQKQIQILRGTVSRLNRQVQKLTTWVAQLNKQLDTSQAKNKQLNSRLSNQQQSKESSQQKLKSLSSQLETLDRRLQGQHKYQKYFKLIDENQKKGEVFITNKAEMNNLEGNMTSLNEKMNQMLQENRINIDKISQENTNMRQYIASLQKQTNLKTKQINQRKKQIAALKQQQRSLAQTLSHQRKLTEKFKKQTQQQRAKSQKQIEQQQQKSEQYKKMLKEYQMQEEKLKKLMAKEQEEIKAMSKNKDEEITRIIREKELELEKQRKNNKLLWTDNKKLKQMQQKLREEAQVQMQQIEIRKKQQIQRLKRQLEKRYQSQLNLKQQEESNSNELKKILQQKAHQIKIITQNHNKARGQVQFYKNRNKELEGVVSRTEKTYKQQCTAYEKDIKGLKEQIGVLQRQNKTNKEVVSVLDKKMTEINLVKQEIEKKSKADIQKLTDQVKYLKQKYQGQKIEQKIALLKKSVSQFQTTLKAIGNTLSCNYCVQPVKQCIRLKECGHIYCKKCKAGYQPNCGECKRAGTDMPDKVIDDTLAKANYMGILCNTVKDDLGKIYL